MRRALLVCTSVSFALLSAACGTSTTSPSAANQLWTVKGSASAPPAAGFATANAAFSPDTGDATGNPSSLRIGVYALYISSNADCSAMVLVQDYGTVPAVKDFIQNPVLFTGSPAAGAYKCVAIKMSDVLRMKPATSFGSCVAGTEYAGDIYRAGENDWKDVNGATITGTGTDDVPSDDRVTIFLTRNPAAAVARGLSPHQTLSLSSDLVVPTQSTFYWNGDGSVVSGYGQCGINPGAPSFR